MRCGIIKNVKIVVADSNRVSREFLVDVLMFCVNREVVSFDNGLSAWEYLKNYDGFHIIISDSNLIEMNGIKLLAGIKKKYPKKKFIIMSEDPAKEETAQQLGADAFLAKPFKVNDLFNLVQTFVVEGTA
jgi:DNA-binding NtrC family response regulator